MGTLDKQGVVTMQELRNCSGRNPWLRMRISAESAKISEAPGDVGSFEPVNMTVIVLTLIQAFYRLASTVTQEMINDGHQMSSFEGLRDVMIGPHFVACQYILILV